MEAKLGKIIGENEDAQRDAIHIAVVPLIAGEDLYTGGKIKLKFGSAEIALKADYNKDEAIGIVDPFLNEYRVKKGERFYGVLFPGTVTGMRHHWQHPKFENLPVAVNEHEQWLREFCDEWNFNYDELVLAAIGDADPDFRYVTAQGVDLHSREELGADHDLFWEHLEALLGQKFDEEHREGMGWSCSC